MFNIFEILSKDDKELSHSSMIKFLLLESNFFSENLINQKNDNLTVHLEYKLDKRLRLDILGISPNKIIAIENKFKSLPKIKQLDNYSQKIQENFPDKEIVKFLLYFEKGVGFNIPNDWNKITYEEIYQIIQEYLKNENVQGDKEVLLRHYCDSLNTYILKYKELKNSNSNELQEIFENPKKGNNGFWLHLIFHELALLFDNNKYFTWVGSGGTYTPLINIHHPKWNFSLEKNYEFVIQLNGKNLKYYAHLEKIKNKQAIIDQEKNRLKSKNFKESQSGKFKGKLKEKSNTSYIYQEDIIDVIKREDKAITIENIKMAIKNLIERIDSCS